ncbi:MAG: uroporphyrinogen decarboxylase family protein [Anaerolineae bacterium]
MTEMSPRERFLAALHLREPDRVPACPWLTSDWFMGYYDLDSKTWYSSLDAQLKAQLEIYSRFPDMQFFPGFRASYGSTVEASAMGCEIVYPPDATPQARPLIREVPRDLSKLRVADPEADGRMPEALNLYRMLAEKLADYGYEITAGFLHGPMDVASEVRGMTDLLLDFYRAPEAAHRILDVATDTCIAWARAQYEASGRTMLHILVSDDVSSQIGRKHWREFVEPYMRRLFDNMPEGVVGGIHNCTRSEQVLDLYASVGARLLQFGPDVDPAFVKEKVGSKMCLLGNLSSTGILKEGTPQQVEQACREVIQKAAPGGGFILSSSGSVARFTPMENLEAMARACEKYGTYPM